MEIPSEITGAIAGGQSDPGCQVPISFIYLPQHTTEKSLQACRVCLLTDCRLYSMERCNLKEMFKQLTGLQLLDDKYPSSLCAECATFLIKCKRFMEKSLTVQRTLNLLSNTTGTVTIRKLKQMRKAKKLFSNLSVKQVCVNYYDTEINVSEDYVAESPTNLKVEQIDTELTTDYKDNCVKLSSDSLVTQNPPKNLDTDIYVCDDDEEEEDIPTSVKGVKIKTELTTGCDANLSKKDNMKLSSNSSVKQSPPYNFDTDIYVYEYDKEETPINIHGKQIKTELTGELMKASSKLSVKENQPYFSDTPYITYTYEDYEENKIITLNDNNLLTIELSSDSDENDGDEIKYATETDLEIIEENPSKEINEKKSKVEFKKASDGSKPATKTEKRTVKNVYDCEQCEKVTMSKPVYLEHLRTEHHSRQHVCCLCGLSFINKRCIKDHKRRKHVKDNPHIPDDGPCCPECSLRFLSEEALQTHLQGPLKDRRISVKHYVSEFCKDLNSENSDSPENEKYLKSEFKSDREKKVNVTKTSTKRIKKLVPTRKVPLDKRIILNNMIVVKRMTLEEQLGVMQKRKDNNQNKPYKCDTCYYGTNLKTILETHMVRHSKEMGELSCNLCHFRFKTIRLHKRHILRHAYKYSCVKCPFTTYLHHIASKHVFQFHEKQKYTCEKCGVVYTSINTLYEHKKMKHPSSQHVCRLCGFSFVNKMGMKTHHNAKHLLESVEMPTVVDGPSCAECSLRFMNEKALQTHMRVSHATGTGKKMVNSVSASNRKQYKRKYTDRDTKKVVCETCGKLVYTYYLKYHLEEHAGKTFPCPVCGKIYVTKTGMYKHKFYFHGKGKEELSTKVKKQRFQCKDCDKTFSSSGNLKKHIDRAHSGNILLCNYCAKQFRIAENLKQHVDHVHLKKPWYKKRAR